MFGVECVPDVANGTVVLRDAAHGLDDKLQLEFEDEHSALC